MPLRQSRNVLGRMREDLHRAHAAERHATEQVERLDKDDRLRVMTVRSPSGD
jgi:hypothetical protein